jgi:NAD-specific glutamate dehydrogenase
MQLALMDELMRLGRRATRWFLRSRRNELDAARDVAHFGPHLAALGLKLDELLEGPTREGWQTVTRPMSKRACRSCWRAWWRAPRTCTPCCRSSKPRM